MEKEDNETHQHSSSSSSDDGEAKEPQPQQQQHASSSEASALVISASFKAGMDGVDRERIDAIILRESSNSLFMSHQLRRDEKVNERIRQMKQRLADKNSSGNNNNNNWKLRLENEIQPEVEDILKGRRTRSTCCVIDMDMFFMACELLTRPELKEKPCCVGGNMISTSNYKARRYGVRSAMAGWIGDKLVEELSGGKEKLIHLSHNFDLYKEKSQIAARVFQEFDPHCKMGSLDECFVDLAPYMALKLSNQGLTHEELAQHLPNNIANSKEDGPVKADLMLQRFRPGEYIEAAAETVALLRRKVCEATGGLTCSAGLAPSFTLAKIASDYNKPDGQKIVGERLEEDVWPFLRPLPTRKIPGIGRVTAKILSAFGVDTVQQLWNERALVRFLFRPVSSKFLLRASLGGFGKDDSSSDDCPDEDCEDNNKEDSTAAIKRKGISRERTFSPMQTWSELMNRLEDIARQLSKDMEEERVYARTISLKIKLQTFDIIQKSRTVGGTPLQKADDLLNLSASMLQEIKKEVGSKRFSLRLIGIRCSNLAGENDEWSPLRQQMSKFLSSNKATGTASAPRRKLEVEDQDSTKDKGAVVPPMTKESCADNNQVDKQDFPKARNNQHLVGCSKPDSVVELHTANCPICNQQISSSKADLNRAVNNHIDTCLNGPVIRAAVRETNAMPKRKKQRLTDYFQV